MSDLLSRKSKRLKSKNDHEDSDLDTIDLNSTEPMKVVDYSLLGQPPAESRYNDQEVICLCSVCSGETNTKQLFLQTPSYHAPDEYYHPESDSTCTQKYESPKKQESTFIFCENEAGHVYKRHRKKGTF